MNHSVFLFRSGGGTACTYSFAIESPCLPLYFSASTPPSAACCCGLGGRRPASGPIYKDDGRLGRAALVRAVEEEGSKMGAKKYCEAGGQAGDRRGEGGERTEGRRRGGETVGRCRRERRRWKRDRDRHRSGQTRRTEGGPWLLKEAVGLLAGRPACEPVVASLCFNFGFLSDFLRSFFFWKNYYRSKILFFFYNKLPPFMVRRAFRS